ncbi:MAG TPA: RsmD family RNA methyltransferase, partial [Stenotrophomonas sp.]
GAASACLVERDPGLAARLREQIDRLGAAEQVEVAQDDALRWLARPPSSPPFDLAFVDPPFAADLWNQVFAGLTPHLSSEAWLYVEAAQAHAPRPPQDWLLHREGDTRGVRYALYRRAAATLTRP